MKMNYFVVGTNDMRASKAFHEALFAGAGLQTMSPSDRMTYWPGEDFAFAIATPLDEAPAISGNSTMVGFSDGAREDVERMHGLRLELGSTCEGAPGQRGPNFSAYVRYLDGNKLSLSDYGIQRPIYLLVRHPRVACVWMRLDTKSSGLMAPCSDRGPDRKENHVSIE